jgi:TIGR03009 family protein
MPRRRMILISTLVALSATGFALAVPQDRGNDQAPGAPKERVAAPNAAAPLRPDPARMLALLKAWEGQSAKLKSLEVSIYRIDKDLAWGDEEHYTGLAAFKKPDLAFVDYRKVKMQAKPDPKVKDRKIFVPNKTKTGEVDATPFETIICTGTEVWHYRYDVRQILIYTLDNDARKRALEEGPLPFLFNLRAGAAQQRYDMILHSENEDRFLVMIRPKLKDDAEVFSTAWVSLNREFLLPTRILLISPDKKSRQDFVLSKINPNKVIADRIFQGVNPGKPWKLERNPGARATAPAKKRTGGRPADAQAAQRPAAPNVDQPR